MYEYFGYKMNFNSITASGFSIHESSLASSVSSYERLFSLKNTIFCMGRVPGACLAGTPPTYPHIFKVTSVCRNTYRSFIILRYFTVVNYTSHRVLQTELTITDSTGSQENGRNCLFRFQVSVVNSIFMKCKTMDQNQKPLTNLKFRNNLIGQLDGDVGIPK
jgi:hypothetical protein